MGTVDYLLDTHTFLWAMDANGKLSNPAKEKIEDDDAKLFVSAVSAYEIMNKYRLGKLSGYASVAENYFDVLDKLGAEELPVSMRHAHFAGKFKWVHRDPFDRLLAAQAFTDNLTLITNDPAFQELAWVTVLW